MLSIAGEETGIAAQSIERDPRFEFQLEYPIRGAWGEGTKTLVVFLARLLPDDHPIELTEHLGYEWMPWGPPHRIQAKTIDPVLAAVERHQFVQKAGPIAARALSPGRILALDFGTRRIGIAISDPDQSMAFPLDVITHRGDAANGDELRKIVREQSVVGLVVGLPLHMSGGEGEQAQAARRFGDWAAKVTGLAVVYQDERLSSAQADVYLEETGLSKKKQKDRRDMLAAQVILNSWLETRARRE